MRTASPKPVERGFVYFDEKRLPIVGRISMDSMMVDITEIHADRLQALQAMAAAYAITETTVRILRVLHGAQEWPDTSPAS
ncbi:alanine racemase C-terminal domain-containing protein [Rhizobium sp. SAFR-030]|uniref:alanine racemase C-terminal domain-containing protein n=1 Tax=Rhizobium sp. SAFR-030 TaxID=3387277 RepID=UPI003F7DF830